VRAYDPDRVDRLFDRRRVGWPQKSVHDRRIPTGRRAGALKSTLLHNRHSNDFKDFFDGPRYAARTEALARELYESGRRVGWLGLWLRPAMAWCKYYLLKAGFTQGAFGLIIAQKAWVSTHLKYARLWHLQRQAGRAAAPTRPVD
jgi:hypothetical protein